MKSVVTDLAEKINMSELLISSLLASIKQER